MFIIYCDCWFFREKDDFDFIREFLIIYKNKILFEGEFIRERYRRCFLLIYFFLYFLNIESECFFYLFFYNIDSIFFNDFF